MKFPLGRTVATANAAHLLTDDDIQSAIARHHSGDWGDVCAGDAALNEKALIEGERLVSKYLSTSGLVFWVITERDRSVTTVLMPEDY